MVKDSGFRDSICYLIYFYEFISAAKADKGEPMGEKEKDITALKWCDC